MAQEFPGNATERLEISGTGHGWCVRHRHVRGAGNFRKLPSNFHSCLCGLYIYNPYFGLYLSPILSWIQMHNFCGSVTHNKYQTRLKSCESQLSNGVSGLTWVEDATKLWTYGSCGLRLRYTPTHRNWPGSGSGAHAGVRPRARGVERQSMPAESIIFHSISPIYI